MKTKALISFAVTAKLICSFVFAYAKSQFSYDAAHIVFHVLQEFMLCRTETNDPRACVSEGKEVTRCGFEFFGKVKKHCGGEFTKYWQCIDHSGKDMALSG